MTILYSINIYVMASSGKNKTMKISDEWQESITTLQMGFMSGQQGEYFFIAKGKNVDRYKF